MFIKRDEKFRMLDDIKELRKEVESLKIWCGKLRSRIPLSPAPLDHEKQRRDKR